VGFYKNVQDSLRYIFGR